MLDALSRNWWMLVARGAFAILFGILALVVPGITLTALVLLFGAYVLIDGGINIYAALVERDRHERWWIGLLEGVVGVIFGVLTFIWPGLTGLVLLYLIAVWAIMTGVLEIMAAIELRKEISTEWLLGLSGVMSIIFGALLIVSPGSGALAVAWLIGFYAIMFGGTMIALGFRIHQNPESVFHAG